MRAKMAKRQFLSSVGAVSGVAAMYRSMTALGMAAPASAAGTGDDLSPVVLWWPAK